MVAASRRGLFLVDTSAFARVRHSSVHEILSRLVAERLAATCVTIDLEAGYSGRTEADVRAIHEVRREQYELLEIDEGMAQRAREVQLLMAQRGHHRAAGVVDLLTAAVAEHHGAVVLHYDADFEHIAETTRQRHLWIAPRGSLD